MRKINLVFITLLCVIPLAACGGSSKKQVAQSDANYIAQLEGALRQRYPLPILTDSSDLKNQIEYATVQSDPNKIEYIAFIDNNGGVYATYTIKGQVSAESTRITAPTRDKCYEGSDNGEFSCVQDQQPDLTGTFFSQAGGGYFAYLSDGALIQWPASVQWVTSDQPFHLTTPPTLSINENGAITPTHPHITHGITK